MYVDYEDNSNLKSDKKNIIINCSIFGKPVANDSYLTVPSGSI